VSAGKHTPGPWAMEVRRDGDIEVGPSEGLTLGGVAPLATVYGDDREPSTCWPVTANAKLIAAAPALADALEAVLRESRDWIIENMSDAERAALEAARAALRAAGRLP
jgi:hypothetical protein